MKKQFSLSRENAMINFTMKYCETGEQLLDSYGFDRVIKSYINKIKKNDNTIYRNLIDCSKIEDENELKEYLKDIFKLLLVFEVDEIIRLNGKYKSIFANKELLIEFIEGAYSFWRKIERYAIIQNNRVGKGIQNVSFIEANNNFTKLVLDTYRRIEETVIGYKHRVYRQIPAGANAGIIVNNIKWNIPYEYEFLSKVPFIEEVILQPPFITYPKKNKRTGTFVETYNNPLEYIRINEDHWFCYPAKVGELLAYVYFHRDFMSLGLTLCNLFELAKEEEYTNKKPDMIYVFGARDGHKDMRTAFYNDKDNDIMIGFENYHEDIDYFGYMKKMILTLHNVRMIENEYLPIHGAMVRITMKSGKVINVVIVGDSGAGKSESLEAFRSLSEEYVKEMSIVFDDMGVLKLEGKGNVIGYGTETGAFVRLDDLDIGYAYKEIDRSIFMNPDKVNARVIIPISTYHEITCGRPVDYIFYANNYEEGEEIEFFDDVEQSIQVFKEGARMAKGTTTETGLVTSYFANPFGPLQRQEQTDILIDRYFKAFYKKGIKVGQIRTLLGISGKEKEGPKSAAHKLFDLIKD